MRGRSGRVEDNALTRMPKCVGVVDPSRYPEECPKDGLRGPIVPNPKSNPKSTKRHNNVAKGRDVFSLLQC